MRYLNYKHYTTIFSVLLCIAMFTTMTFASAYYASNENGSVTPPDSIDHIDISTETVQMPKQPANTPLTPDGNISLIDDLQQSENYISGEGSLEDKQFITVQSKNGNYFYIVIDRSGDTENVHFLNLVDEADLMALLGEDMPESMSCSCTDRCIAGNVNTGCPICETNMSECAGKEQPAEPEPENRPDTELSATPNPVEEQTDKGNGGVLLVLLFIILVGGAAFYWFKIRKGKPDTHGSTDLDDYDYGEDEIELEEDEDTLDDSNDSFDDGESL